MRRTLLHVIAPAAALLAGLAAACTSAPIDYDRAVRVHLENPTPMRVWVQFTRSAGGAAWTRSVGPDREEEHLVRHRAFGDGPVRVFLIRWPGTLHLRKVYGHAEAIRVPPGSELIVRLERDLRRTTVWMAPGASSGEPGRAGPAVELAGAFRPGEWMEARLPVVEPETLPHRWPGPAYVRPSAPQGDGSR